MKNVKTKIEKRFSDLASRFGENENVILLEEAYHACHPDRPNGWDCRAVRIDGAIIEMGHVCWDFDQELEDASSYDWSFGTVDFKDSNGSVDLDDEDDYDIQILCDFIGIK